MFGKGVYTCRQPDRALRLFGSLALAVTASLLTGEWSGSTAFGQSKPPSRYDVFDFGDIPADPSWHSFSYTAFAINESNSVAGFVGMRISGFGDHEHAIFWTPVSKHGFSAFTLYDLTMLAGLSGSVCPNGSCSGFGFDINDGDILVGSQQTEGFSFLRGFISDLPTNDDLGGLQTFALDSLLSTPTDGRSQIHGINDASPPVLVGEALDEYPGGGLCNQADVAFRVTFSGTPGPMTRLDAVNKSSVAFDVNEAATARVAGQARATCGVFGGCAPDDDAQRWTLASVIEPLPESVFDDTVARAINNSAQSCGDSGEIGELACPPTALFWDANGSVTVLGDPAVAPQLAEGDQTQAFGISPSDGSKVNVVGTELILDRAILWHRDALSAWSAYDLSVRMFAECPLEVLNVAHDINSSGWIVGRGKDCLGRIRGFVLRPAVCPADLDGDCDVGAPDLAVLLGWWGTQELNDAGTFADLDQDGDVGASDLASLLGAWGPCGADCVPCGSGCGIAAAASQAGALEQTVSTPEMLTAGLGALGFNSVAEFVSWASEASPETVNAAATALAEMLLSGSSSQGGGES